MRPSLNHPQQKAGHYKDVGGQSKEHLRTELFDADLKHLSNALLKNGYSSTQIRRTLRLTRRVENDERVAVKSKVFLPFIKDVTDRIGKILTKRNVAVIYKPTRNIQDHLKSVKDARKPLEKAEIEKIPCSCGDVYVGTTKRTAEKRLDEHKGNCRRGEIDRSAVAENVFQPEDHLIQFDKTQVLAATNGYHERLYREAIEIVKHPNNFNRMEEGVKLNEIWIPVLKNKCNSEMFVKLMGLNYGVISP